MTVSSMRNFNLLLLGMALFVPMSLSVSLAQENPPPASEQSKPKAPQPNSQPSTVEPPPGQTPNAESPSAENKTLPGPQKGGQGKPAPDVKSAFIIGPEDVLAVRVWDEPNLSGPVTVGPDGMISLQLIHEVKAAGLTTSQLEAALAEQLKAYRNNPEVSVQVQAVRSRKYLIQGGVGRSGTFPLTGPTTVLEALGNCGGFKEFANPKKIYILRTKPDGTAEKIKFNYKDVSQGKHMEQNILVQNGDQIFVPE